MELFIFDRIIAAANISKDEGIEKYKKYFVNTHIYARYKEGVDKYLRENDYAYCVVESEADNE